MPTATYTGARGARPFRAGRVRGAGRCAADFGDFGDFALALARAWPFLAAALGAAAGFAAAAACAPAASSFSAACAAASRAMGSRYGEQDT